MEITLLQAILLTIMTIIVGLDFFLEAFFIFRPLIVSTLTGLILGDITLGLKVGALIELAFAGLTPAGGTQPPNPVFAAVSSATTIRLAPSVFVHVTPTCPCTRRLSILVNRIFGIYSTSIHFYNQQETCQLSVAARFA